MEQLSGISSTFLAIERPTMPMVISSVAIYQGQSEGRFAAIREAFLSGISQYPIFRRRLLTVPALMDHPYWIEDPDFDVDCHLRRLALPEPGNWQQFNLQLARLQSTPMHRDRPLWQAFVIEGLNGLAGIPKGSFAIVVRVHRAIADASALNDMMIAMHELDSSSVNIAPITEFCVKENSPKTGQLLLNAVRNNSRRVWSSRKLLQLGVNRYRRQRRLAADMPELPKVDTTRFNNCLPSSYRVVTHFNLKRSDCEQLQGQVGGSSVCDVVLSVIGGALRLYLDRKGELPEHGLVAGCAQQLPSELGKTSKVKRQGAMRLDLHLHSKSPLQRLRAMQEGRLAARARNPRAEFELVNQASELMPPLVMNLGAAGYLRAAKRWPGWYNTFITGIRGSDRELYFAGAPLLKCFTLAPLLPGCSLVHSIARWGGDITIGVNACREALPDPENYVACMAIAWEELQASVLFARQEQSSIENARAAESA